MPNREAEPKAFLALLRMVSPAVTPMVASPSVRKITSGTRLGVRCFREEDEGLMSWAADSRAALMLVPIREKIEDLMRAGVKQEMGLSEGGFILV